MRIHLIGIFFFVYRVGGGGGTFEISGGAGAPPRPTLPYF